VAENFARREATEAQQRIIMRMARAGFTVRGIRIDQRVTEETIREILGRRPGRPRSLQELQDERYLEAEADKVRVASHALLERLKAAGFA
jgi:hypothetical protein